MPHRRKLAITFTREDDTTVLRLVGEMDAYSAPGVKEALLTLLDLPASPLVLDLEELTYLDATGMGVMIGGYKRFHEQKRDFSLRAACASRTAPSTVLTRIAGASVRTPSDVPGSTCASGGAATDERSMKRCPNACSARSTAHSFASCSSASRQTSRSKSLAL